MLVNSCMERRKRGRRSGNGICLNLIVLFGDLGVEGVSGNAAFHSRKAIVDTDCSSMGPGVFSNGYALVCLSMLLVGGGLGMTSVVCLDLALRSEDKSHVLDNRQLIGVEVCPHVGYMSSASAVCLGESAIAATVLH